MKRIVLFALVSGMLAAAAGCADRTAAGPDESENPAEAPTGPPAPSGMVVSNPLGAPGISASRFPGAASSVAYVSAEPGTFSGEAPVLVRNATAGGSSITITLVNGGFDPVGIAAQVGDELSLSRGGVTIATIKVPRRQPPRVVRTNPAKGRTDVALNILIGIVFSEPMDPASLTSSLTLRKNGDIVPATVRVPDDGLSAELIPDSPLDGLTTYTLVVDSGIRDLDGDAIETGLTSSFTTAPAEVPVTGGGSLVFVSERDGNSELYLAGADGSNQARLTNNPAADFDPAWSPDGTKIAFVSDRGGQNAIYVMNADGTGVSRFGDDRFPAWSPTWSPDGLRIAFSSFRNGQLGIYVMNVDHPDEPALQVGHPQGWQEYPAWSPDGGKIAFTSDWRAFDFLSDLYVTDPDGSGITPLLEGPFFARDGHQYFFQPAWSPDGSRVAVVTCAADYTDLFDKCHPTSVISIANADGTNLKSLVATAGFARPTWSPDGSLIAFSSRTCRECVGTLKYVRVSDGTIAVISNNGHSPSWRR